ncbi:hypothetical protein ACQ86K_15070 [Mucilaginibacter sp. P19]
MQLLAPLYKDYRSHSEQLIGSFAEEDLKIIEKFLEGSIAIMSETVNQFKDK